MLEWCSIIQKNTEHWLPTYQNDPNPLISGLTASQFKIAAMKTVLQKYLGVRYDMNVPQDGYFDNRDSRIMLIHGPLLNHGGTCVTLPTLMAAIGRQVGYPLFLVESKGHYFLRWDDYLTGERFNIDATAPGFVPLDDEHYKQGPIPITEADWETYPRYLKNLTPHQEIGMQIQQRAHCLVDNLRFFEALIAYQYANAFDPCNYHIESNWKITIVLGKAFDAVANDTRRKGKTHHPLRKVRLQPPREKWEPAARKPAQEILDELKNMYGENHKVRVA